MFPTTPEAESSERNSVTVYLSKPARCVHLFDCQRLCVTRGEYRDAFDLYFRQRNDWLRKEGFQLDMVRWENFLDAMSATRLQDEYNKTVRECDIFVSLFSTVC
jgi:hypothetical protein